jgi:hypothetical protein
MAVVVVSRRVNIEPVMITEALRFGVATESVSRQLTNELIGRARDAVVAYHKVISQQPGAHRMLADAMHELEELVGRP